MGSIFLFGTQGAKRMNMRASNNFGAFSVEEVQKTEKRYRRNVRPAFLQKEVLEK
jgi:hypothetical protein